MEFNGTFLVSIITFLVFVFLMNKILYVPMAEIVAKRKQVIDENYQEAHQFEQKTKELESEVEEKLNSAKKSAREIYGKIVGDYKGQGAEIVKNAQESSKKELEEAYLALENVSNEAKENLKSKMTDLANDITEKVLGYRSEIQDFDNDKVNELLYSEKG